MPFAYVLINTEIGTMEDVLKAVKEFEDVKEAHTVYGVYDLIVKVEAETMEKLKNVITGKLRRISNVRSTLTMIVIET